MGIFVAAFFTNYQNDPMRERPERPDLDPMRSKHLPYLCICFVSSGQTCTQVKIPYFYKSAILGKNSF